MEMNKNLSGFDPDLIRRYDSGELTQLRLDEIEAALAQASEDRQMLAEAIKRIHLEQSISSLFIQ